MSPGGGGTLPALVMTVVNSPRDTFSVTLRYVIVSLFSLSINTFKKWDIPLKRTVLTVIVSIGTVSNVISTEI